MDKEAITEYSDVFFKETGQRLSEPEARHKAEAFMEAVRAMMRKLEGKENGK